MPTLVCKEATCANGYAQVGWPKLRAIAETEGLHAGKFADASGFTQQYISGLELGRRNPTIVTLFELATTLGVSHFDLVLPDDEARSERSKPSKKK